MTQSEEKRLQREPSCLSSVEGPRGEDKTEDAPHCVTCYCLSSKIKCSRYRPMYERCAEHWMSDYNAGDYIELHCNDESKPKLPPLASKSSSRRVDVVVDERRLRKRKTTTVDELLRQMKLDEDCSKTEEDEQPVTALCSGPQNLGPRHRHRPSGTASYRNRHRDAKLKETSTRNLVAQRIIEDIRADASSSANNKLPENDDWQPRLPDNAMLTVEKDRSRAALEAEESSPNLLKEFDDEAHVRELKLVRWDTIKRIREEVLKLHRLQQHLDSCSSPRGRHTRRSVYTMTADEPSGA